jgi:hypothetical protein
VAGPVPLVVLLVLIVALPLPSGLSARTAATHPAGPSASLHDDVSSAGTGASAQGQAMLAAQASLARAWGVTPTLDPDGCLSGAGSCTLSVPKAAVPSVSPIPAAGHPHVPPLLTGAAVVYDANPDDDFLVLFGGVTQTGANSAQTWIYQAGFWENLTPNTTAKQKTQPTARWDAMMTYDAADRYVVMFGGCTGRMTEEMCTTSTGDTWKFAYPGVWVLLLTGGTSTTNGGYPSPRWDGAMTYDSEMHAVVMYGGSSGLDDTPPTPGTCYQPTASIDSDTWTYSQSSGRPLWTSLSATGPPALYGGRLADDAKDGMTILFGGTSFFRTDQTCTAPTALGLTTQGSITNGTWALSASGTWSELTLDTNPAPRYDANMATGGDGRIILEGGANGTGTILTDAWEFYGPQHGWVELTAGVGIGQGPGTPTPRFGSGFAWDIYDQSFFMFGGMTPSGSVVGDAWSFVPPEAWTLLTPAVTFPTAPSSRYQEAMAFDDALDGVVLFGGEACGASACSFFGDTWLFSLGVWQKLSPSISPSPRFGAAMDYNPWTGAILLFGGCGTTCPLGDSWQLARSGKTGTPTWTQLFPSVAPPARYFAAMAFDAYDKLTVLFGGCEGARGPCPVGDTWTYNSTLRNWKLVPPVEGVAPQARFGAAVAALSRTTTDISGPIVGILLFGGQGTGGMLSDTWNFSSGHWTEQEATVTPGPREFGTLVLDPIDSSLVLVGGCEPSQCPALDPWLFSLEPAPTAGPPPGLGQPPPPPPPPWPWTATSNITSATSLSAPGARYGTTAVWDPVDGPVGYVMLVGGRLSSGITLNEVDTLAGYLWTNVGPYV